MERKILVDLLHTKLRLLVKKCEGFYQIDKLVQESAGFLNCNKCAKIEAQENVLEYILR